MEQAVGAEEQKMFASEADPPFPVADVCHFPSPYDAISTLILYAIGDGHRDLSYGNVDLFTYHGSAFWSFRNSHFPIERVPGLS